MLRTVGTTILLMAGPGRHEEELEPISVPRLIPVPSLVQCRQPVDNEPKSVMIPFGIEFCTGMRHRPLVDATRQTWSGMLTQKRPEDSAIRHQSHERGVQGRGSGIRSRTRRSGACSGPW
eukprot:15454428-Alexandrium_andersonii.AAC.1